MKNLKKYLKLQNLISLMSKRGIPIAAIEILMKKAGAERVSDKAKETLKRIIEKKALDIGTYAARFAQHAGRKTIKAGDIHLVVR